MPKLVIERTVARFAGKLSPRTSRHREEIECRDCESVREFKWVKAM